MNDEFVIKQMIRGLQVMGYKVTAPNGKRLKAYAPVPALPPAPAPAPAPVGAAPPDREPGKIIITAKIPFDGLIAMGGREADPFGTQRMAAIKDHIKQNLVEVLIGAGAMEFGQFTTNNVDECDEMPVTIYVTRARK